MAQGVRADLPLAARAGAAAASGVAAGLLPGLGEWIRLLAQGRTPGLTDATATLLAILVGYGALGCVAGAAGLAARARRPEVSILALAVAAWAGLAVLDRVGLGVPGAAAALAVAWGVWHPGRSLLRRLPGSPTRLTACAAVAGLGTALAWPAAVPDGPRDLLAAGAGALALAAAVTALAAGSRPRPASGLLAGGGAAALSASLWIVLVPPGSPTPADTAAGHPSVLLVTIDTLRADRVGAYGHAAARTPVLDRLASRGVRFRQALTHSILTGPSHTSILTGLHPDRHGVLANHVRVPEGVQTAAELFARAGYVTAAFVGGYTTTASASGLPPRFQVWDDDLRDFRLLPNAAYELVLLRYLRRLLEHRGVDLAPMDRPAGRVVDAAAEWLRTRARAPFLLWVHLYDPHLPYRPPRAHPPDDTGGAGAPAEGRWYALGPEERRALIRDPERVQQMLELYDAEIAYADSELGRLLDVADRVAPEDRRVTLVTADHGESMGEHGIYWDRDLYDASLRVPLVITSPGLPAGRAIDAQARLVDVLPTLLDLAGLEIPADLDGRSLTPPARGRERAAPRPARSAIYEEENAYSRRAASVRHRGWKLISRSAGWAHDGPTTWLGPQTELYDLRTDRAEEHDLSGSRPERVADLSQYLGTAAPRAAPRVELDARERRKLRALGYLPPSGGGGRTEAGP